MTSNSLRLVEALTRYCDQQGLELVFSPGHQYHDRIFYDPKEGKYYDRYSDLYLEYNQLKTYGLGV